MKIEKELSIESNEKLLNAIGEIDDALISDAFKDTKKRKNWIKWGSLAAMLLCCVGIGFFGRSLLDNATQNPEFPGSGAPESSFLAEGTNSSESSLLPDSAANSENSLLAGNTDGSENNFANSIVFLDVNPSIALVVDADEKIISAQGLNEDGNLILSGMDLTGVDMTVAVNALVGSMLQKGYLSDLQNAILVSVENEDADRSAALQERISAIIGNTLQDSNLDGTVLSQTVNGSSDLEQMAQAYQISLGKAALIQEVMAQDASLTIENLAPLSITEIALISQSKNLNPDALTQNGTASDKAYISQDTAMEIAYEYAHVNAADVTGTKVEFDSDKGIMIYEVEFHTGTTKYECDIDALSGQIVKYETENIGAAAGNSVPSASGSPQSSGTQSSGQFIGEEAAKNAALSDANIAADNVIYINAWLDYDNGRPKHYDVEFAAGNTLYEYEIDLYSGAVLERETENYGHHEDTHHDEHHNVSGNTTDIGADAAKAAAFSHAGCTASRVTKCKADCDYDDGLYVYEVEFEYNGCEYEYKIDAATGAILEYDIDD